MLSTVKLVLKKISISSCSLQNPISILEDPVLEGKVIEAKSGVMAGTKPFFNHIAMVLRSCTTSDGQSGHCGPADSCPSHQISTGACNYMNPIDGAMVRHFKN